MASSNNFHRIVQRESEVCAFKGLIDRHAPHSQQWMPHRHSRSSTLKRPSAPSRSLPSPRRSSTRPSLVMVSRSAASGTNSWTGAPWPDPTPSSPPTPGAPWLDPTPASSFPLFPLEAHPTRSGYPPVNSTNSSAIFYVFYEAHNLHREKDEREG
ncbi:hypothetical protein ACFX13_036117 [Malus domestica]